MTILLTTSRCINIDESSNEKKPNIIFLLTDDLDVRLGSMIALNNTMKILKEGGANMSNFFVNTPICCPSRSTFLSGKFEHNNVALDYLDRETGMY